MVSLAPVMSLAPVVVLLLVVALLAALAMTAYARWCDAGASGETSDKAGDKAGGGASGPRRHRGPDFAKSSHLVVDTLNLAHWRRAPAGKQEITTAAVIDTIDATAAALRARHPGRVMYVLKDRESRASGAATHAALADCAKRNQVYIILAERYSDPPRGNPRSGAHSARGRDDFLLAVLAARWRCAALTEDRFRDFGEFRSTLQPFHATEFAYWSNLPTREYYRPESPAYSRLKAPRTVRYADYF